MKYITITDKANEKTSEILAKARSLFKVCMYDENNVDTQFPAPDTDITVSFLDEIESDKIHKGKSYDYFMGEKDKTYMTMRQYLLMAIKVFEERGKHLDIKDWTRTSSLWLDGYLVYGGWIDGGSKLYMGGGDRDGRDAGDGPREQFFLESRTSIPSSTEHDAHISDAIKLLKTEGFKITREEKVIKEY